MLLTALGVNDFAQELIRSLLVVAGLLAVAILWAWQVYGESIEELYDERYAREPVTKISALALGEPAVKNSSVDWTKTWHTTSRVPSPRHSATLSAATCVRRRESPLPSFAQVRPAAHRRQEDSLMKKVSQSRSIRSSSGSRRQQISALLLLAVFSPFLRC